MITHYPVQLPPDSPLPDSWAWSFEPERRYVSVDHALLNLMKTDAYGCFSLVGFKDEKVIVRQPFEVPRIKKPGVLWN